MRHRLLAALSLLTAIASFGNASPVMAGVNKDAQAAYRNGSFDRCIEILVSELKQKPDHQDNIALMEQAIPLAIKKHQSTAGIERAQQDWDAAFEALQSIEGINRLLSSLPPVPKKVEGKKEKEFVQFEGEDVTALTQETRDSALVMHYTNAVRHEGAENYKEAAVSYRKCRMYDSSYRDAASRYDNCRAKATLKIAVMPFEDKSGKNYGALGDLLTNQVIAAAMGMNPEFLQFVTRDYLQALLNEQGAAQSELIDASTAASFGKLVGVHSFVFGKLLTVIESYPSDASSTGENSFKEYTKRGEVLHSCRYTIHERKASVRAQASFQIIDVQTGVIKKSSNLDSTAGDGTSWVTYSGDEDAIPAHVLSMNLGERSLKNPADLCSEAVNALGTDLARVLTDTFK